MPLIFWAIGVIGVILLGRALLRQAQRIDADLRARETQLRQGGDRASATALERDPVSGVYRPKNPS